MKQSKYSAKKVDTKGFAQYTAEENQIWERLYARQMDIVDFRACDEYLNGIKLLDLPSHKIPQCPDISKALKKATGWTVEPVAALISHNKFFKLLSEKRFPAATFIRSIEELDYLEEPDIFHEIFGHCPMLTNQAYADFTESYGKRALAAPEEDRIMYLRLYWFTVEFGLIQTAKGLKIYGGGILSSKEETLYALESETPKREPFDLISILRTPYKINILQPIYYVLQNYEQFYDIMSSDIPLLIKEARKLGMFPPLY